MKKQLLLTFCLLLTACLALAQARPSGGANGKQIHRNGDTSCGGGDPVLPTDGSLVNDFAAASSTNYYFVHLKDGHSYAAEIWDATDTNNFVEATLSLTDITCTTKLSTTDVVAMDPDLSLMYADRISWIQSGDTLAVLGMSNGESHGAYYAIRIVDTTLRNPRFSTVVGFGTHYGLLNTTGQPVQGTLTLHAHDGSVYSVNLTVPGGGQLFEIVSAGADASPGLMLPVNDYGYATFAYVGPAGAILPDGYYYAVQNGVSVIVPTNWGPRNSQH